MKNFKFPVILALLVSMLFSFESCRTYTFIKPTEKNTVRIRPLIPYVKLTTLPKNYGYNQSNKDRILAVRSKADEIKSLNYSFKNAVEMFGVDLLYNTCLMYSDSIDYLDLTKIGTAELTITKFKKSRNPIWFFLGFPGAVVSILGAPVGSRTGKIGLSVDIKDASGNIIKTYVAKARHTAMRAAYWGYSTDDAKYAAHDKAFIKAMKSIRMQMEADAAFLNSKLDNAMLSTEQINALKYFNQGEAHYKKEEYAAAVKSYETAKKSITTFTKDDATLLYHLGYSLLVIETSTDEDIKKCIANLLQSNQLDPKLDIMVSLALVIAYQAQGDDENALKWIANTHANFTVDEKRKKLLDTWKSDSEIRLSQINAGKVLLNTPVDVKITNLGNVINTSGADYFPSLAADESILYFTSRREGSTGKQTDGLWDEDLWFCTPQADSSWGKPQNMGKPVNTENNNGIASFTGDGQYVICARCGEKDGVGNCDIYGATLKGNQWDPPVNLGPVINSKEWDAQASISVDGKILVWASQREGGKGKQDIWMSKKDISGQWQAPINLGDNINTAGTEYSPFLSPDCKTLYFGSNYISPRIGNVDTYKSTLQDDGTWGKPENLGYPINSEGDDYHFVLSPSGLKGYFASSRAGGFGESDIYSIAFPDKNKSSLITFVGYVFDEDTKAPIEASITIQDLETNEQVGTYISNMATGKFIVVLIPGRNYALSIDKVSYLFYSENFDIPKDNEFKEIEKTIYLQKIKVGKKIVLNNIFFDKGLATLSKESFNEIDKLVKIMVDNPKIEIEIGGHTDNVGADAINIKLSKDRAQVVVDALVSKGVTAARMKSIGYGSKIPIINNETEENKQMNRRTEFKILLE